MVLKIERKYFIAIIISVVAVFLVTVIGGNKKEVINNLPISGKVIVVDAGHGGFDGGAVSKDGISEKNITLSISKYLKKYLEQSGAKVIMTRSSDTALNSDDSVKIRQKKRSDLLKRREIANTSGGDAFISIHINFFSESKYKGAQVFYESKNPDSMKLAASVQEKMIDVLEKENKRTIAKIADNKILYQDLKVPSILAECGFLSNPDEAMLLNTEEYREKVAYSIYLGILEYFSK